jgi:hypothetical protein
MGLVVHAEIPKPSSIVLQLIPQEQAALIALTGFHWFNHCYPSLDSFFRTVPYFYLQSQCAADL